MAEQTVELEPGQSEVVSFTAVPSVAKTYQVSADGLSGSFKAIPPTTATISGYVWDYRSWPYKTLPIMNAKVTVGFVSSYTDKYGKYEIANIPLGIYTITIEAAGYETNIVPSAALNEARTYSHSVYLNPVT